MTAYFCETGVNEGAGIFWAFDGDMEQETSSRDACALCGISGCEEPPSGRRYRDNVWYLSLGTRTRYADATGHAKRARWSGEYTHRNVISFSGASAVMHLGSDALGESRFLVFDRLHTHRVMNEMRIGRNTVCLNTFQRHGDLSSYRAMWSEAPSNGGSKLFHRWLTIQDDGTDKRVKCVEHANDIPLDCRNANLNLAHNHTGNNTATHRLSRAHRSGELTDIVASLTGKREQQYVRIVKASPPLPDCVFVGKSRRRRARRQMMMRSSWTNREERVC